MSRNPIRSRPASKLPTPSNPSAPRSPAHAQELTVLPPASTRARANSPTPPKPPTPPEPPTPPKPPTPPTAQELTVPSGAEPELRASQLPDGTSPLALVLGGTGYVGGRLIPRLVTAGYRVRILTRNAARLDSNPWNGAVDVVEGDASDFEAMASAMKEVTVVFHLVHSMSAGKDFESLDRDIARTVARAAGEANVQRIIYLGGLHPDNVELSHHLASRKEVGDVLLNSTTPTIVLQAGVIIGSGSASFEMVRHLTDVLPFMPAPRWVQNRIQPISIRDILYYLLAAARVEGDHNQAFDIGGPDVLRYCDMMNGYGAVAGLPHRYIVALPVLTPRLASHWVGLVTPVPRRIARPLVESLQHDCVMKNHDIDAIIPPPTTGLTPYKRSVELALARIELDDVETSWVDARVPLAPSDPMPNDPDWSGRTVNQDNRESVTSASPDEVWKVIMQIGGDTGWYSAPFLWAARGVIDRFFGGVGLQRGRRSRSTLRVGDAVDFWRVEQVDPGRLVRLRAEMRLPGQAWLELGVEPDPQGSKYTQRAVFIPKGLSGRLYWLAMLPFHGLIFSGMSNRIVSLAQGELSEPENP